MNETLHEAVCGSPLGSLLLRASAHGIAEIVYRHEAADGGDGAAAQTPNKILRACMHQLDEYFAGTRRTFDVPLDLQGTLFQQNVWRALLLIPCGATWSYGRVAQQVGRPTAVRAVGGANHNNPVPIIVPCHRVIGGSGKLTGYASGLWRKQWLLEHEAKMTAEEVFSQ